MKTIALLAIALITACAAPSARADYCRPYITHTCVVHSRTEYRWATDHCGLRYAYEVRVVVPPPPAGASALDGSGKTRKQLKTELRDANSEVVRELVRFSSLDHRQVNAELNRLSGVRKITEATYEQLERRLEEGNRWLRRL